jgi:hypothetical protein
MSVARMSQMLGNPLPKRSWLARIMVGTVLISSSSMTLGLVKATYALSLPNEPPETGVRSEGDLLVIYSILSEEMLCSFPWLRMTLGIDFSQS